MHSADVIIPAVSTQLWWSLSDSLILQHPRLVPRRLLLTRSLFLLVDWDASPPCGSGELEGVRCGKSAPLPAWNVVGPWGAEAPGLGAGESTYLLDRGLQVRTEALPQALDCQLLGFYFCVYVKEINPYLFKLV